MSSLIDSTDLTKVPTPFELSGVFRSMIRINLGQFDLVVSDTDS